jgi:HSP20 family protein
MNILKHKDLLHSLLKQGDVLNTLNGGTTMTYVEEQHHDDHQVLSFWAPSVPAEAFNIVLNSHSLVVFSLLQSSAEELEAGSFNIPMFFRKFKLPSYIDMENIEAVHEGDRLSILLPYKESGVPVRKVNIWKNKDK